MTKKFHKFMSKTKIKKIKILYKQKLKKPERPNMNYINKLHYLKESINAENKGLDIYQYNPHEVFNIEIYKTQPKNEKLINNYYKYENIKQIPIKKRIIITKHADKLDKLFKILRKFELDNFSRKKLRFNLAVLSQTAQDYLEKNGDPEKANPLLLAVIDGAEKWYNYILANEPLENLLKYNYNMKLIKTLNLENKILDGHYKRTSHTFQGADVMITNMHTSWADDNHPVISFQKIEPRHRQVVTRYYFEVSWVFFELQKIYSDTFDFINKFDFYGILAQKALDYLEKNGEPETPIPLLLAVIEGAREWSEYLNKGL